MAQAIKKYPSQNYLNKLFKYKNGHLYWRKGHQIGGERIAGVKAGTVLNTGYVAIYINQVPYQAHRLIWILHKKGDVASRLDHRNRNRRDNRLSNLRLATNSQNITNQTGGNGQTKYKGVYIISNRKKKFWAAITVDKNLKGLGMHYTAKEAALSYNKAAKKFYGKFACLNDI